MFETGIFIKKKHRNLLNKKHRKIITHLLTLGLPANKIALAYQIKYKLTKNKTVRLINIIKRSLTKESNYLAKEGFFKKQQKIKMRSFHLANELKKRNVKT